MTHIDVSSKLRYEPEMEEDELIDTVSPVAAGFGSSGGGGGGGGGGGIGGKLRKRRQALHYVDVLAAPIIFPGSAVKPGEYVCVQQY